MDPNDLFERYLQAVRKYLPAQRQDDIIAEFRANLEAQREEREAELGRPLSEGEMIDWLKELGPPIQVAARYQAPRYLIGPSVFPLYWRVLRIVVILASAVYIVSNIVAAVAQPHDDLWFFRTLSNWPTFLLIPAAWVTIAFVVLEFFSERYPEKCQGMFEGWPGSHWSPTSLPPLEKQHPAGLKPRSLITALAEFFGEFVLLLWVLLIPHFPFLLLGPGVVILHYTPLRFTPPVVWFYWAVVAFSSYQFVWHAWQLLPHRWRLRSPLEKVITKGLGIVPIGILIAAPGHIYVQATAAGHLPAGLSLADLNHGIFMGVTIIALITILQFLWDLWKLISTTHHQPTTVLS